MRYNKSISEELAPKIYAVRIDPGDELFFEEDVLENSSRLIEFLKINEESYPPLKNLIQDVYHLLYKYSPEVENYSNMETEYALNQQVIEHLNKTNTYLELRQSTRLDQLSSQISTEILCENLLELVHKLYKEQEEQRQKIEELKKKIQEMQEDEEIPLSPSEKLELEEAKKKLEEQRQEMKDKFDSTAQRSLQSKLQISLEQQKGIHDCIQDWGLGNDGSFQRLPYRDKVSLIEKLQTSTKLKKISLLAGRLKEVFLDDKKKTTKKAKSTLRDMSLGNDVGKVIAPDIASLALPQSKILFYKSYVERTLRQHEYGGKTKKGKGAIVALIDTSASMAGDKEIWAKAVSLTLLDISRKQRRNFFVVHFDSGTHKDNLHTNSFMKTDPYNIQEVIDMAEFFGGGGTEFEPPLDRARDKISEEHNFSKADIIMISDGQSAVRNHWLNNYLKWKTKNNIVIYSIVIEQFGSASLETLKEFSDQIQTIKDLRGDGDKVAIDLFKSLNY